MFITKNEIYAISIILMTFKQYAFVKYIFNSCFDLLLAYSIYMEIIFTHGYLYFYFFVIILLVI